MRTNYLKTEEILFQSLPVKFGFHSKNITPIEERYKESLAAFKLGKPDIPFISCMHGGFAEVLSQEHFWRSQDDLFFLKNNRKAPRRQSKYLYRFEPLWRLD